MKRKTYMVTVDVPDETSLSELREHIRDAVWYWEGHHQENPLFNLKVVSVRPIKAAGGKTKEEK